MAALVIAGGAALLSSFREHAALLEFKHAMRGLQQTIDGFAIAEPGAQARRELSIPSSVSRVTFEGMVISVTYENGSVESYEVSLDMSDPTLTPGKRVLRLTKTGANAVTIEILE